jgi:hypothetical protein
MLHALPPYLLKMSHVTKFGVNQYVFMSLTLVMYIGMRGTFSTRSFFKMQWAFDTNCGWFPF